MVWLMGAPYLIMKELDGRPLCPTEVAKALDRPIAWVSKRTGRMEALGLIIKEGPDDRGRRSMALTEKGERVMNAISAIEENPFFVELRRALDLKAPEDAMRSAVRAEAERVKKELRANEGGCDIGRLYKAVMGASSMRVESWYASNDLTLLLSTVGSERWDGPSRLLLLKLIGRAINDSRSDREYVTAYNGLLESLFELAVDEGSDINVRLEAITAIGSLRDRNGKVPNGAFLSVMKVKWETLAPNRDGSGLVECAISEVLQKWMPLLNESQRGMLFRSVDRMLHGRISTSDDLQMKDDSSDLRKVDEKRLESYRSLVASLLNRDVPKVHTRCLVSD